MTRRFNMTKRRKKMHGLLRLVMLTALTGSWMLTATGCRTTPTLVIIPQDRLAIRMSAKVAYTPEVNGWFVPDARMNDILNQLDRSK